MRTPHPATRVPMRVQFKTIFRGCLSLLVIFWAWALWAAVATTNAPASSTNRPSALLEDVERFSEHPLTFNLDQVPALRDYGFLGEPLWKYLASLIYVLLAFYATKLIDFLTRLWLKRFASRSQNNLGDLLLQLLRGPIKIVIFVVLL